MASIDMPLEQLKKYNPEMTRRNDFSLFWKKTIDEARKYPLNPELKRIYDYPSSYAETHELTFSGFGGHKINGWYLVPKFLNQKKIPVIVVYCGYGGGRAQIEDYSKWLLMGCAVAVMDTRGQGDASGDMLGYTSPAVAGWMTKGILDKYGYFYRAVFTDAIRILDFVYTRKEIDGDRVAVTGISQGGGITIAAAGLDNRPVAAMIDIPFLCNFKRGIELSPVNPYLEVAEFVRRYPHHIETVYETLTYFDGMNLSVGIKAQSLWSVGLWDDCCPPSTIFAAYNNVKAKKEIRIYPYNKHEIIPWFQVEKTKFISKIFRIG